MLGAAGAAGLHPRRDYSKTASAAAASPHACLPCPVPLPQVPPGTIVRARGAGEDDPPLSELLVPGDRALMAVGGRGGRGNLAFKSSRNTAPAMAEFGEKVLLGGGRAGADGGGPAALRWREGEGAGSQLGRGCGGPPTLLLLLLYKPRASPTASPCTPSFRPLCRARRPGSTWS